MAAYVYQVAQVERRIAAIDLICLELPLTISGLDATFRFCLALPISISSGERKEESQKEYSNALCVCLRL